MLWNCQCLTILTTNKMAVPCGTMSTMTEGRAQGSGWTPACLWRDAHCSDKDHRMAVFLEASALQEEHPSRSPACTHSPLPTQNLGQAGGLQRSSQQLFLGLTVLFFTSPQVQQSSKPLKRSRKASCNTIREIGSGAPHTALHPAKPQRVPGGPFAGFHFSGAASAGGH